VGDFNLKKHILVIDDETIITQVLAKLLLRSSYKVTIALNGQQGIELFRADPADLVIVDIFMPEVDGVEVIRTLKDEYPETRFIAISGGATRGQGNRLPEAQEVGAECTLEKPIENNELLEAIEKLLGF
jgi:CheY-like chemotaxis protein